MSKREPPAPAWHIELSDSVSMPFQLIGAGEFVMGSRGIDADHEEPPHCVRITRPFYLGTHPVTQAEFEVWTKSAGVEHCNAFEGEPTHPAERVTWQKAMDYCFWQNRTQRAQLPPGYVATLPTEAEWEYACRAGSDTEYWHSDGGAALAEVARYAANSGGKSHPVGAPERANEWGLQDMHGQVWEWCWDLFDEHAYRKRPDGVCDPSCDERAQILGASELPVELRNDIRFRVMRGGSWGTVAGRCRSAYRIGAWPGVMNDFQGFRVCVVPGPAANAQVSRPRRLGPEPAGPGVVGRL